MRGWVGMMAGAMVMTSCSRVVWSERHKDAAVADVRLEGNALEQTVRCHHNAVHVLGNESRLTFVGSCTKVYVEGNRNWMEVQDAGVIETTGFMNSVLYLNPNTRTVDKGKANSVAPKWQQ